MWSLFDPYREANPYAPPCPTATAAAAAAAVCPPTTHPLSALIRSYVGVSTAHKTPDSDTDVNVIGTIFVQGEFVPGTQCR